MWSTESCRAGALVAKGVGIMLEHEPCLGAALLHVCLHFCRQVWQRRPCLTPAWVPARQNSSPALGMYKGPRVGPAWGKRYLWVSHTETMRHDYSDMAGARQRLGAENRRRWLPVIALPNSFSSHFWRVQEQHPPWPSKFLSGLFLNHELLSGKRLNTILGLISEAPSKKANCTDLGDSVGNLITYSVRSALASATCVPWVMKQPSWEANFWSPPTNPSFQSSILPSGDMTLPNPHGHHRIALYTV